MRDDFCAFILTHGRPDKVLTYRTLRRAGYTGKIFIVVDDEDKTRHQYMAEFGEQVLVFSKTDIASRFDEADNFCDRRSIFYARNACFDLAKLVGCKYFIQLDDDYHEFQFRVDRNYDQAYFPIRKLDAILSEMLAYYESIPALSIAMSQGGDFLGDNGGHASWVKRKAMNSFICSVDRPFSFMGRINEDVNTYTNLGRCGELFMTISQRLPAQERHQQRPLKHQKVLPLQSPQKARRPPVPVRRKRQKRMRQRHNNQPPLLHPPRPRKRQKLPPQPGMRRPQKRQRNHQKRTHHQVPVVQLPRQRRQEIPRRPQKRLRRMRITAHRRQQTHKLHRQTPRQQPKNQKPTRKIARQQQRAAKPTLKPAKLMLNPVKQTRRNLRRTHLIIATMLRVLLVLTSVWDHHRAIVLIFPVIHPVILALCAFLLPQQVFRLLHQAKVILLVLLVR